MYFWFDQLFGLMNADWFEGGWPGVEFEAYYMRDRLVIPDLYHTLDDRLWARVRSSGWYQVEYMLSSFSQSSTNLALTAQPAWFRRMYDQLGRFLTTPDRTRDAVKFLVLLLIDQLSSASLTRNPALAGGHYLAQRIPTAEADMGLNFTWAGAPQNYSYNRARFLAQAGFLNAVGVRARLMDLRPPIYGSSQLGNLSGFVQRTGLQVAFPSGRKFTFRLNDDTSLEYGSLEIGEPAGETALQLSYRGHTSSEFHDLV